MDATDSCAAKGVCPACFMSDISGKLKAQPFQRCAPQADLAEDLRRPDRRSPYAAPVGGGQHPWNAAQRPAPKKGEQCQAAAQSRGGRTTKIHALSDAPGQPLVLALTQRQATDLRVRRALVARSGALAIASCLGGIHLIRQQQGVTKELASPGLPQERSAIPEIRRPPTGARRPTPRSAAPYAS